MTSFTCWLLATIAPRQLGTFTEVITCCSGYTPVGFSLTVSYAENDARKQEQRRLCKPCTMDHLRPANAVARAKVSEPWLWETALLCWAATKAGLKPIGDTAPEGERLPLKEKGDGPELPC